MGIPAIGLCVETVGEIVVIADIGMVGVKGQQLIVPCLPTAPQPTARQRCFSVNWLSRLRIDECQAVNLSYRDVRMRPVMVVLANRLTMMIINNSLV